MRTKSGIEATWNVYIDPKEKTRKLTKQSRGYFYLNGQEIPMDLIGKDLPAATHVVNNERQELDSLKLFTNLPVPFYQAYLKIQNSSNPFKFPTMGKDKSVTVRDVMGTHTAFKEGALHPSQWRSLGWESKDQYTQWLDKPVLFAFAQCFHYCSVYRVFDCTRQDSNGRYIFDQVSMEEQPKKTNILSVTGFEYRNFKGEVDSQHLKQVERESKFTMQGILQAAEKTNTTDIVLIPYGLGVFITCHSKKEDIKNSILRGMADALSHYDGPPLTIHCCGDQKFCSELESACNSTITFKSKSGYDAYTIANSLTDNDPKKNVMLINAADDDWKALLAQHKKPGQCAPAHQLYDTTSDEYFALVTNLSFYSIQNLFRVFKNITNFIVQIIFQDKPKYPDIEKREFLSQLGQLLADPDKIDKAVFEAGFATIDVANWKKDSYVRLQFDKKKQLSLYELEAYGVFNEDGSLTQGEEGAEKKYGIKFDEKRIELEIQSYRLRKDLSLREKIIFASAIRTLTRDLSHENDKKIAALKREKTAIQSKPNNQETQNKIDEIDGELNRLCSYQPIEMVRECLREFRLGRALKLTHSFKKAPLKKADPLLEAHRLNYELVAPAKQIIGMGYYKFKDTNVSISPGPNSAKSYDNPDLYDAQGDIAEYLKNLLDNGVSHVFAIGRVFPYHPQEGSERKIITSKISKADFINYFIPDANGQVKLPNIPELKDIHITSRPIKKAGRCITYEISINGRKPIQVHHFPIRNKQPLDLTQQELAYIKEIGKSNQNIHTHCREGKGSSAQIAYILASLNPKYAILNPDEQLAQMRTERNPDKKSDHGRNSDKDLDDFIETKPQKDSIFRSRKFIHQNIVYDAERPELYILLGTLLKQEINKSNKLEQQDSLLDLMEKYQDLSSIFYDKLGEWVNEVCKNKILSESTRKLFTSFIQLAKEVEKSIKPSEKISFPQIAVVLNSLTSKFLDNFLEYAFNERTSLKDLELFFDLKAKVGEHTDIIPRLRDAKKNISDNIDKDDNLSPKVKQLEQNKLDEYLSLFIAHIEDAYIKNPKNLTPPILGGYLKSLSTQPENLISKILSGLQNPQQFTREKFEQLEKEFRYCKQRLDLLEKSENKDKENLLDEKLRSQVNLLEQFFFFGYDYLVVSPEEITLKMDLLYQRLNELSLHSELSPDNWNKLKEQFVALKTLFNNSGSEKQVPTILTLLDKLFQEKREQTVDLFELEVLQVKPEGENLSDFLRKLCQAVEEAARNKLPLNYYAENNKAYLKEITHLLQRIDSLTISRNPEIPMDSDYEEIRSRVLDEILQHSPVFLTTTTHLIAQFRNLLQDILSLGRDNKMMTSRFWKLKKYFTELEAKYKQNGQTNNLIDKLINNIKEQIKNVPDLDEEKENLDSKISKEYYESKENALRIKLKGEAEKSRAVREIRDQVEYSMQIVERKKPKKVDSPKRPKLIVFDVDTLRDLSKDELKLAELINTLKYAKNHNIKIALINNNTPDLEATQNIAVAKLKTMIYEKTKINISDMLTFLDDLPLHLNRDHALNWLKEGISELQQRVNELKSQKSTLNKEVEQEIESKIANLKKRIDFLQKTSERLISGKFMHLDSIRRHYNEHENLNTYYLTVEKKILRDFKHGFKKHITNRKFTKNKAIWIKLFKLAETLMELEYPAIKSTKFSPDSRPSLKVILKDIILAAQELPESQERSVELEPAIKSIKFFPDSRPSLKLILKDIISASEGIPKFPRPALFSKKYGTLSSLAKETIALIKSEWNYFKPYLSEIESFYQERLAIRKKEYEEKYILQEEDVLFLDNQQVIIDLTSQQSNYRVIKVSDPKQDSSQYLIDFNYELGAYNHLIAYLNDDLGNFPTGYKPNSVTGLVNIPNFSKHEFQHSPIVLHVKMSKVLEKLKLPEFSLDEEVAKRYRRQFFEAAIDRFDQLSKELQDDFVTTFYDEVAINLATINQKLKKFIQSPPAQLIEELTKLKSQVTEIIEMDKKFTQRISPTFLGPEADLLKSIIDIGISKGNLTHLNERGEGVQLKTNHDETRISWFKKSMKENRDSFLRKIYPALKIKKEFIIEQYHNSISDALEKPITDYIKERKNDLPINLAVKDFSFPTFLAILQNDLTDMKSKIKSSIQTLHQLCVVEKLCREILPTAPYQNIEDDLRQLPTKIDYEKKVNNLLQQIERYKKEIVSSDEYKAEVFLDEQDKVICNTSWEVRFQREEHIIVVDGVAKKIPATIAKLKKIIDKARINGNYVEAKQEFLKVVENKTSFTFSSPIAINYYVTLQNKNNKIIEKKLEDRFNTQLNCK